MRKHHRSSLFHHQDGFIRIPNDCVQVYAKHHPEHQVRDYDCEGYPMGMETIEEKWTVTYKDKNYHKETYNISKETYEEISEWIKEQV